MMGKLAFDIFNCTELSRIIEDFGAEPRIFNSEAQFQFELAWEIKKRFDCIVKLEELSRVYTEEGKPSPKKDYTDIILEKGDQRIAIELKYKTSELELPDESIFLKNHGATDLGSYDFLWDVNRLQMLISGKDVVGKRKYVKGYAVFLTNEKTYWEKKFTDTIDREFLIGGDENGEGCLKAEEHKWHTTEGKEGTPKTVEKTSRKQSIILNADYKFQWKNYCNILNRKDAIFRFIVVEVSC